MTNPEAQQRCSACEHWSAALFDIKVETERVQFAESNLVPDPHKMIAQHIAQVSKAGLCIDCVSKELLVLKARPDRAMVTVSWPSNGGPNG